MSLCSKSPVGPRQEPVSKHIERSSTTDNRRNYSRGNDYREELPTVPRPLFPLGTSCIKASNASPNPFDSTIEQPAQTHNSLTTRSNLAILPTPPISQPTSYLIQDRLGAKNLPGYIDRAPSPKTSSLETSQQTRLLNPPTAVHPPGNPPNPSPLRPSLHPRIEHHPKIPCPRDDPLTYEHPATAHPPPLSAYHPIPTGTERQKSTSDSNFKP